MDERKGEAFSSNASESTETVAKESGNEGKVGEEGGPSNGDDIMVEVLGSHVYVDGICTSDGGGALGNSLNDEVVREEDGSTRLDGGGKEAISGGEGDADVLKSMQEDEVRRDGDRGEGDELSVQGVSVINHAEDKKQDTVATSASGQPTESAVEDQLANEVQSDKTEHLQVDKQVFGSEQQLMEIERHSASSEIHHTGSSKSDMVDLFPEESGTQLKTEASLGPAAKGNPSIEEETKFEKPVSDDQKVNLSQDQEVQVNEASVEMVGDGTENTGIQFADSASLASNSNLLQSHVGDLGDVDMQNNNGSSVNDGHVELVERDQQQISGDEDVTHSHSGEQDMHVEETVIGDEFHDRHSGQETNGEEQEIDQDQDNNAEEETKRQTAPDSPVKLHYAKYELPPEDGEFCVSDLVWGKVRSHPWWPGQIFDPSDASEMAMKHHKKDGFLVAYFGDRTFAWNEASVLKRFRAHFSAAEKQNSTETFQNAVNCALEEVFRRVQLGLVCSCSPKEFYDEVKFQIVKNTGIRQESSVKDVSDRFFTAVSFEPDNLLQYIKGLAQFPCGGADKLEIAIAKAQLSAFYCLRGYHPLPKFRSGRGLVEADTRSEERISDNITNHPSPMNLDDERVSSARKNLEPKRGSYYKRKHDLKGGLYPCKRERSLSELMGGTFDSLDTDGSDGKPEQILASPSSSKKRKAVDSFSEEMVQEGRKTISLAKVSLTPQPPKPSFKIGECISRVASQMTGSPSVLKGPGDRSQKLNGVNGDSADGIDLPSETYEDAIRKFSSSDQLLCELHLAASDPMKDFSFLNVVVSFFHDFRNSLVIDNIPGDKEGGKRKRLSNSVIGSAETFEFEDMSDTYWTDRIVQNGSEEQLPHGNGRGQYEIVPVELQKPVQRGRKSRKRYSDGNHDAAAGKPPGYVNERAPAELVMTFSELNSVPSEAKLNKMFRHFGPLKESETEVDWETSRARVVFRRCSDAEVALNSAEKFNIFGPVVVNYQLNYSISESFKASLYAPALPEETHIVTQSLGEHTPLIGSTPGNHNQLIVSTLGEDASFMVSTLADESLPLPSSFGEDTSYMTVTFAEETSNVTAHAGEESFTITTTACMETLAAGISESRTIGEQTSSISPDPCEQIIISDNTMVEQTTTGSITADVQTQTSSECFGEPTSIVSTSICELTCTASTTTFMETSMMPPSASEQTCTVTTYTVEEQLNISTTSGEEESIDARTVSDQTLVSREMHGEQASNITASLGEEASDMAASFGQEYFVPRSLAEGSLNADTTLGEVPLTKSTSFEEQTSAVPAMSGEEISAGPTTFGREMCVDVFSLGDKSDTEVTKAGEALPLDASRGEEMVAVAASLAEESVAVPATSIEGTSAVLSTSSERPSAFPVVGGQEISAVPATMGEDLSAAPMAYGEETSPPATADEDLAAAPMASGEETSVFPATTGGDLSAAPTENVEETSAVPVTAGEYLSAASMASGEETSAVPATADEDLSAAHMASGEETSAVPATADEDLSAAPMASDEETSAVPATAGEELSAAPMASGEETSVGPVTTGEDLSAAPMASGEETSAVPATADEDLSAAHMTSGEETSAVPATAGEELSAAPMASGEETSAVPVTKGEDLSAAPMESGEETSAVPVTTGEDLSAAPMASGEETSAVPATADEDLSAAPMASGEETSAVPATAGEQLSAAPMVSGEETSAVPVTTGEDLSASPMESGEETSAVPATAGEDLSAAPMTSGEETSVIPATTGEDLSAAPMASGVEISAVPATESEDLSVVPRASGEETSAVPATMGEDLSAAPRASCEETSAVPATTGEDLSAVPMLCDDETSAVPVAFGEETPAGPVVSGEETVPVAFAEETSAVPVIAGAETSAVPVISGEETSTVPVASGHATSTVPATNDDRTSVPTTSSGGKMASVLDPGDQSLTITTTAEETSSFAATISEESLTVDMTSMVAPTLTLGILTIATTTGDGTSSSGLATSAVITSVNETPSTVTMTLHGASSTIATIVEATSTVPMTLDETSSTVTTASDMETESTSTTQVEEYAT